MLQQPKAVCPAVVCCNHPRLSGPGAVCCSPFKLGGELSGPRVVCCSPLKLDWALSPAMLGCGAGMRQRRQCGFQRSSVSMPSNRRTAAASTCRSEATP